MHAVLACVGGTARRKIFIVAWMKESTREEGREYYGGGGRGNLLCPSVLLGRAVRVCLELFCLVVFSVLLSLSHSLVNGCWFLRNDLLPSDGIK